MAHNQPSTEDISVSVLEIRWSIFSKHFRQFLCSLLVCYKNILCFMWPFFKASSLSTKMWVFRMSGENLLRHYSRWHLFFLILVIFAISLWWSFFFWFWWSFLSDYGEVFMLDFVGVSFRFWVNFCYHILVIFSLQFLVNFDLD